MFQRRGWNISLKTLNFFTKFFDGKICFLFWHMEFFLKFPHLIKCELLSFVVANVHDKAIKKLQFVRMVLVIACFQIFSYKARPCFIIPRSDLNAILIVKPHPPSNQYHLYSDLYNSLQGQFMVRYSRKFRHFYWSIFPVKLLFMVVKILQLYKYQFTARKLCTNKCDW